MISVSWDNCISLAIGFAVVFFLSKVIKFNRHEHHARKERLRQAEEYKQQRENADRHIKELQRTIGFPEVAEIGYPELEGILLDHSTETGDALCCGIRQLFSFEGPFGGLKPKERVTRAQKLVRQLKNKHRHYTPEECRGMPIDYVKLMQGQLEAERQQHRA